jgi:tetratricopeptide (TPR) repeat protein
MRYFSLLWIALLLSPIFYLNAFAQSRQNVDEMFTEAQTHFEMGRYQDAINVYLQLLDEGHREFGVHYNLGMVYLEQGETGRALVQFFYARSLMSRDAELERNIQTIRALRTENFIEVGFVESVATSTEGLLTEAEYAFLLAMLWAIGCMILGMDMVYPRQRFLPRRAKITFGVLLGVCVILFGIRLIYNRSLFRAIVITDFAIVRSGPNEGYPELYQLHQAAETRIVRIQDDWFHFVLVDGRQGWISGIDLEIAP